MNTAQKQARMRAQALTRELRKTVGGKWTIRVWENLGWHHEAVSRGGRLRVGDRGGAPRQNRYEARLSTEDGLSFVWYADGPTPWSAVHRAEAKLRAALAGMRLALGEE